jgi:hypothetical protein
MTTFRARLVLPLPEGWHAKESITLLAPDGQGNVIASSEPLDPSMDARHYADVQGELLHSDFNEYREHAFEPALVFGGRPGYVRVFSWKPENGDRITQIQAYYAANSRGYTLTATTPSATFEGFEPVFRRVLQGVALARQAQE